MWFVVMAFGLVSLGPHCVPLSSAIQFSSAGLIVSWFLGVAGLILSSPCNTTATL